MRFTLRVLMNEKHPLIEKQLIGMKFTKDSINNLKASVALIKKIIFYLSTIKAFDRLKCN